MYSTTCITNHQWETYSTKTLSYLEVRYMREHVKGCRICSNIKEGIDGMKAPESLMERVTALNAHAFALSRPVKKVRPILWFWSAAAVILLGIGVSWFLISDKEEIVADNSKQTSEEKIPSGGKDSAEFKNGDKGSMSPTRSKTSSKNVADDPPTMETVKATKPEATEDTKKESKDVYRPEDKYITANGTTTTRKMDTVAPSPVMVPPQPLDKDDESSTVTLQETSTKTQSTRNTNGNPMNVFKKSKSKTPKNDATTTNANDNYKTTDDTKKENKASGVYLNGIDSVDYLSAQNNFATANYDKAITNLYYITINPNSKYYEDGLLLKAKTLLKQNKKEDAKVALNTVILLNRNKRKEAADLLNSIK